MVKFTSTKILLVALVIASLAVDGKRRKGKNKKRSKKQQQQRQPTPKKTVDAAELIRQIRGKDVSESDPFRWDESFENTLLEGNKFDQERNKAMIADNSEDVDDSKVAEKNNNGGWTKEEDMKNEIPSSVGYINGQAYIKNPNYPAYLTKPGLSKKIKRRGSRKRNKNKAKVNAMSNAINVGEDMGDLLADNKRSAPAAVLNVKPTQNRKQANKRMPYHMVYKQKCWNGVFQPEDGMIVDARTATEILSAPAIGSNVISIPAGPRWNEFMNYDIQLKKHNTAIAAGATFIPRKPLDDMSYIQNAYTKNAELNPESSYKFQLACSNLHQCQNYYKILKEKGLPACIYDGDYNEVLENDHINAFFMGLGGNAKPGANWARSFSDDGEGGADGEEGWEEGVEGGGSEEDGSGFMDPFYALDLAMPDYTASGDYSEEDYWYEDTNTTIAKVHEIGKTCSSEYQLSRITGVKNCDGWSNMSKEDCVQKCGDNELPSGCPESDEVCKYAVWNAASNWCQVVKGCDFVDTFGDISADKFILNEVIEV